MKKLVKDIRLIIESAKAEAVRSVDFNRVQMYWKIGRRIVEEEQGGKARAKYGDGLINNLAKEIEPEYGSGFFISTIKLCTSILFDLSNCERTAFTIQLNPVSCFDTNT